MSAPHAKRELVSSWRYVVLLVAVFVVLAGSAMLYTSTTFDEIVFSAAGARGMRIGDFGLVSEHPRLPQYLYGLPLYFSGVNYPPEELARSSVMEGRYEYARAMFWYAGNSPERLALLTRAVGLAFGAATVLVTFLLGRPHLGEGTALFAAALVAFLPDMLAHSGVAYSDVPFAFAFLVSVYALDRAVRSPTPARIVMAGLACTLALCVKYSGVVLGPILIALLAMEAASGRWRDAAWRRAILRGMPLFVAVAYASCVLVYLGDWRLEQITTDIFRARQGQEGRDAFLWGQHYTGGRWYFFPVVLALKTPLALHVLALLAAIGALSAARRGRWRGWLVHGARAPAVGAAIFMAALVAAPLNIGSRHALPLLPLFCILVAQGVAPFWRDGRTAVRAALALVFASFIISSVRAYPYFLSYLGEAALGRPSYETLVDSSTDWGHGLIALRTFMRERDIPTVALGYWGSALPQGYGIRYVPYPSYFDLPVPAVAPDDPRYLVVSATMLAGFTRDDPYAAFRTEQPVAVLGGGTLYVFDRDARAGR